MANKPDDFLKTTHSANARYRSDEVTGGTIEGLGFGNFSRILWDITHVLGKMLPSLSAQPPYITFPGMGDAHQHMRRLGWMKEDRPEWMGEDPAETAAEGEKPVLKLTDRDSEIALEPVASDEPSSNEPSSDNKLSRVSADFKDQFDTARADPADRADVDVIATIGRDAKNTGPDIGNTAA